MSSPLPDGGVRHGYLLGVRSFLMCEEPHGFRRVAARDPGFFGLRSCYGTISISVYHGTGMIALPIERNRVLA